MKYEEGRRRRNGEQERREKKGEEERRRKIGEDKIKNEGGGMERRKSKKGEERYGGRGWGKEKGNCRKKGVKWEEETQSERRKGEVRFVYFTSPFLLLHSPFSPLSSFRGGRKGEG